jgi:beta-phosphoglucomutase-like phosphatase (HAD superfamily)
MSIHAVVFDLDGLLVDTESVFSTINNKILAKHDKSLSFDLEQQLMGTRSCEAVRILLSATGLEDQFTPDEYLSAFQAELDVELPNVKEMPGATKVSTVTYSCSIQ